MLCCPLHPKTAHVLQPVLSEQAEDEELPTETIVLNKTTLEKFAVRSQLIVKDGQN